jgi:hypothetical protein
MLAAALDSGGEMFYILVEIYKIMLDCRTCPAYVHLLVKVPPLSFIVISHQKSHNLGKCIMSCS